MKNKSTVTNYFAKGDSIMIEYTEKKTIFLPIKEVEDWMGKNTRLKNINWKIGIKRKEVILSMLIDDKNKHKADVDNFPLKKCNR